MNDLAAAVNKFFELLNITSIGHISQKPLHPIYIGCFLPQPTKGELYKCLEEMRILSKTDFPYPPLDIE